MTQKPLLIIDFLAHGHHASHICHLVRFGIEHHRPSIGFLIPSELHDRVLAQLSKEESIFFLSRVRLIEEERAWIWICKWIKNNGVAQCLYVEYLNLHETKRSRLLYLFLESVIYQLALVPIPRFDTSGLMFRPTFYYRERQMLPPGRSGQAIFATKWLVGYLCAKRNGITRIFVLDPLAEDYARSRWGSRKFKLVPDPMGPQSNGLRPIGHVDPVMERPLSLLIAGALAPRKGIHLTVDALSKASEETKTNVRLVVIGKPESGFADYVSSNLMRLREIGVEVVSETRFVSDLELDEYLAQSHVVLTPYIGFKGSSGIVIRAAHFGKPVISTNEGLLGHLVDRYKLGEAIDVENVEAFSKCLDRLASTGNISGFDPATARSFADSCNPEEFAGSLSANPW